jgi:hypothetical protein
MMEEHSEEEANGRIEEVGHLRARGVPFGEIARRLDLDEPQVRLRWQAWLEGRKAEREADGLQLEDILAQYDEVLREAWDDHERLGEEIASLDVHTARVRSESLRIALSAIDRKASLLALSRRVQGAGRTSSSPGGYGDWARYVPLMGYYINDPDAYRRILEESKPELIEDIQIQIDDAKEQGRKSLPALIPWSWEEEENEAWLQEREARESKTHREEGGDADAPGDVEQTEGAEGRAETRPPNRPEQGQGVNRPDRRQPSASP